MDTGTTTTSLYPGERTNTDYFLMRHYPRTRYKNKLVFVLSYQAEERLQAKYRPKWIYYGDTSQETQMRMLNKWLTT